MKIAVIGVGAMGSVYAGMLAEAGHEVWAVDTWEEQIEAIADRGLRIEGASGDRTVSGLRATTTPHVTGPCDLWIIATKAAGVGAAAQSIRELLTDDSIVLTIQNGLGAAERIAEHMDMDRVLLGVAEGFGASMVSAGHVHHNNMRMIRIGEVGGGLTDRLASVVEVWQGAGFEAKAFEDIDQLIWEKFVCNVTLSGPCTVFGCTVGELLDHPERWEVATSCTREAHAVGVASGVHFSFDDPVAYVTEFASNLRGARPSMLLDHLAQRRSEIDAINGQVSVVGRRVGVATPHNDTVSAVVRSLEERF